LFNRQHYSHALGEYYAVLDSLRGDCALYHRIALCHYFLDDSEGLSRLQVEAVSWCPPKAVKQIGLLEARLLIKSGDLAAARLLLSRALDPGDLAVRDETHYLLGLVEAFERHWTAARARFAAIDSSSFFYVDTGRLSVEKVSLIPYRNPLAAAGMSAVVPGAGYAYAGQYGTGLSSFVINGVFLWVVHDAIREKNFGILAASGLLGTGWYFGNILGSYQSAVRFNTRNLGIFFLRNF
jgi:hypothetical protein